MAPKRKAVSAAQAIPASEAPATPGLQRRVLRQLFAAWVEAAAAWRSSKSDATEARCRAARATWYQAAYGTVPPLAANEGEQEQEEPDAAE
jgi:hypothetical protein